MRLVVILPAYNEEGSIADVLVSIPKILDAEIEVLPLVVNDGSTDDTVKIAKKFGAVFVSHPMRSGLAAAFRTGLAAALSMNADLIATLDADGQYRGEELQLLLSKMQETGADLIVGDRQIRKLSHMPTKHRVGNIVGSAMLRLLRCTDVSDASSGFRLFTKRFAHSIRITSIHTYTHEMLIQAKAHGFHVAEVPVTFLPRKHGKSKLVRSLRHHILRSCGTIVRAYFRASPIASRKRVLFVTRSLQSGAGGMQLYARTLIDALKKKEGIDVRVLGYGGGRFGLPFFLLYAWIGVLFSRSTFIHFGDALTALPLPILRFLRSDLKISVTVYGLDLVYPNRMYQWLLRHSLPHAHRVVAISHATAEAGRNIGVSPEKIVIIPCAVLIPQPLLRYGEEGEAPHILLLGRQIKRKGTIWFLAKVLPKLLPLFPDLRVTIAGDGPELPEIRLAISWQHLQNHIVLLGHVSEERKKHLYAESTLFLMPNISVAGDMEGFGFVAIEAASHGLPVVAARLEGIADAVIERETGILFTPENPDDCIRAIKEALSMKWHTKAMREVCRQKYNIDSLASSYIANVWN